MKKHLETLRDVQLKLSGLQDGLAAKANELNSPFIDLLVVELEKSTRRIDTALTCIQPTLTG